MGIIASDSRDDWSAWTGNKLAPGWFGNYTSAKDDLTSSNQRAPPHQLWMDTIAYLPDPLDSSIMTNVGKSHSRYTVTTTNHLSSQQLLLYYKYTKANDLATTKFLPQSLDPALMCTIEEKLRTMIWSMWFGYNSSWPSNLPWLNALRTSWQHLSLQSQSDTHHHAQNLSGWRSWK